MLAISTGCVDVLYEIKSGQFVVLENRISVKSGRLNPDLLMENIRQLNALSCRRERKFKQLKSDNFRLRTEEQHG